MEFLARHVTGDWGELPVEDKAENHLSLQQGFRLLSSYRTSAGDKLWVITEADRSATTLLLPEELLIPFLARAVREARPAFSTQPSYASLQYHGRFRLPRGELLSRFTIDINSSNLSSSEYVTVTTQ